MAFHAKDIQEIVKIPKIRYEYLARQIGIVPDIEEAEGTGNVHKFSFKNLMEFAIAERCSLNGLSMRQIKFLMELLHKHAPAELFEQTEPDTDVKFESWFLGLPGGGLFVWQGKEKDVCLYKVSKKQFNESLAEYHYIVDSLEKLPDSFNMLRNSILSEKRISDVMNDLDGCIHINAMKIKINTYTAFVVRQIIKHG